MTCPVAARAGAAGTARIERIRRAGRRAEPPLSGIVPPARFVEAGEAASTPGALWPAPDWWRGFGSEALDALMQAAAEGNFDLAAVAARVRQADAQLRIAGSALLPRLDADASAQRSRSANFLGNGRSQGRSLYALTLSASYEVDFWNRLGSLRDAAAAGARAARFDVGVVALTVQASVANTFFDVLRAEAELRVQEENIAVARRVLGVIRAQVTAGIATGLDLAQQETVVAQQEAQLPPLRQTVAQGRYSLATLTGRLPEAVRVPTDGFDALRVPPVSPGLPAELLARRPDLALAEQNLLAANLNVAAARAALLPAAVLTAQGGFQSLALGTLIQPERTLYALAASLAQTVFDGGALRGQVELNRARAEELLVEYRRAIVSALEDVESSLVALRETTEREALQARAVEIAARAYAIAEAQLRAGTINLIALLTAQTSLFSARVTLVRAQLERLQAAVGLFRALGGGWL